MPREGTVITVDVGVPEDFYNDIADIVEERTGKRPTEAEVNEAAAEWCRAMLEDEGDGVVYLILSPENIADEIAPEY